jgi:hypothetical protein
MQSILDNGQERRQYQRYKAEGIGIHSTMILASYMNIVDLSLGGMSFEADRRLNMGKKYSLNIKTQGVQATVQGVVVWCSLTKNTKNTQGDIIPIYKCGIKFTDVDPIAIQQIIDSIERKNKEIKAETENEYIDLGLDFIQENDKAKLEDFITSLYE